MSKLKPCPFCGGEAQLIGMYDATEPPIWVACNDCEIETGLCDTQEDAVKRWNRRVENAEVH